MPSITPTTVSASDLTPAGTSRLICVASKQFPRYSEADVIALNDGRLLLAVARKDGASDFAPGEIISMVSTDAGITWSDEPTLVQSAFDDVGDLMSISFCRTSRGVHLFFLGRGPDAKKDTRVYQMISADEGTSWGRPTRVSERACYHVVNNARIMRTKSGRIIVPSAFLEGAWEQHDSMGVYVLFSDDEGVTWARSNDLTLAVDGKAHPLMEPGVAECTDGSLYMTIRTKEGVLYEARSHTDGATWDAFGPTKLPSPAAPSTVVRMKGSDALWMFWCDRAKADWKGRSRLVFASSKDDGRTWSEPRVIEDDRRHSFGYTSVTPVRGHVLLTYYDWRNDGQPGFERTNLRARRVPLAWFDGEITPPVFRTLPKPVLERTEPWEGNVISMNSGLVVGNTPDKPWQTFYTTGNLGSAGEHLAVCRATSSDRGLTWKKSGVVLPQGESDESIYHASAHEVGEALLVHAWRRDKQRDGLYRFVSKNGGETFAPDPDGPLIASQNATADEQIRAGDGRICNDAFDVLHNADGLWELFAAGVTKATDPRTIVKHDNATGRIRRIVRSTSRDGVQWTPTSLVIEPDYDAPFFDPFDTQFYSMQVLRHRGFYLGLLQTFFVESQTIQPEWAWSHDGHSWARTRTPCISLGDEGAFDSRMILFGSVVLSADELIWFYSGYNWRHNAFKKREVGSAIGRATMPRDEFEHWLDVLPQP